MPFERVPQVAGWSARLRLAFARRAERTVLVARSHEGPLVVQKALHPEGPDVCHAILVHPPGGIAGGDALALDVSVGPRAHALLTTPGATRWYRTQGPSAAQRVALDLGDDAIVEWLPQEAIVFDGAEADASLDVSLGARAAFVGWDVVCLGRIASGERFSRGRFSTRTRIAREGRLEWLERGAVEGGDALLDSPIGFAGAPVLATLVVAAHRVDADLCEACRTIPAREGRAAYTRPHGGVLVGRWLGSGTEAARAWLMQGWSRVRPAIAQRPATPPRIFNT